MEPATLVLPKPAYNVLRRLTGESRPDVALGLALKDLARLRLEECRARIARFEEKHGMPFPEFAGQWRQDAIPDAHSYEVEQDYWAWEAAVSDQDALTELADRLP
jgi:hypothetical protein